MLANARALALLLVCASIGRVSAMAEGEKSELAPAIGVLSERQSAALAIGSLVSTPSDELKIEDKLYIEDLADYDGEPNSVTRRLRASVGFENGERESVDATTLRAIQAIRRTFPRLESLHLNGGYIFNSPTDVSSDDDGNRLRKCARTRLVSRRFDRRSWRTAASFRSARAHLLVKPSAAEKRLLFGYVHILTRRAFSATSP